MFMIIFVMVMAAIVILGTFWGWRNVIIPYVFPAFWFLFKASQVIWWTLFVWFLLSIAPPTWRMWGTTPLNYWVVTQFDYEKNITPEGDWTEDWRQKCLLNVKDPPYAGGCSDWKGKHYWCAEMDWCKEYKAGKYHTPGYHRFPTWTLIIPPILIGMFVAHRRRVNANGNPMAPKRKRGQPAPPSPASSKAIVARARRISTPPPLPTTIVPVYGTDVTDDGTLSAALTGLGYKKRDIKEVLPKVEGTTLDARLRSALKLLRTVKDD
jgi:hypothetical protein